MRKRSMLFAWAADLKDNKPTMPEVTTWREMAWASEWTHKEENTAKGRERHCLNSWIQPCLKIDTSAFSVIWANNLSSFLLKSSLNPFSVPGTNWDHSFWVSELAFYRSGFSFLPPSCETGEKETESTDDSCPSKLSTSSRTRAQGWQQSSASFFTLGFVRFKWG